MAVGMGGCEGQATSASEAIQQAKELGTPEQQAQYLVGQAKAFLNSKEYQEAIKTAQYVLTNIEADSQEAKDVLEQAQTQLADATKQAAGEAKKQLDL
jgi:hypothetical protein